MTQRVDRRTLLTSSAAVGAGAVLAGAGMAPGFAETPGRRVAVLGGGMAGLTAAHELVERGFTVTVFEPSAWGGKARSIPVAGTGVGGRADLPGEHGFRFFPGFYHHVPDTMRRIPFGSGTVGDNLVAASGGKFLRAGDHADAFVFGIGPDPAQILTVDGLRRFLLDTLGGHAVPPHELTYFVERLLVFLTSCDERRLGQWEKVSWWDFVGAAKRSGPYQKILAAGLTRNLVAAKETIASTRTIGNMGEAFVYNLMGRGNDGALDRVLDLPTNEAWIDPWMIHLRGLGVRFVSGQRLVRYETGAGRITSAVVADAAGVTSRVEADWFVSAMPVERVVPTLTSNVLALDPGLKGLTSLQTDWMVGIQFFLRDHVEVTKGHITFIDSPWSLTALTQGQFWADRQVPRDYGDGEVVDILSVDISNWDAPGILSGKTAKECTRQEIADEVLAQIRAHHTVGDLLPEGIIHSWFLDPGVQWDAAARRNTNETPLLVNTVDSWSKRPTARTKIPNLLMTGDFVQTDIDLATMEGANESARHAVNAILDASRSTAVRATTYRLYDPPEFALLKQADKLLYRLGQRNALDLL
ncbi:MULTISPECIES: hydroxysqualene dehydroxylase [unclassified Nocardioides]|uniref:hydroxysqualene dehydroxylase n=1 Tax=unclassified Nocardioides TaxID=2615069 RepID=UPI0006FF30AB|nr:MULTISPECIES: FAD-dependent oxidoreductase [unclassified Nocardioides]KRA37470.1 FAD-dependent oxidoreductase [Nocardioides sp. Root614]KRA91431.1 FAD-dependent oxidoreductase [Nocardioides sp. Root682]